MNTVDRRGELLAALGASLSAAATVILVLLAIWSGASSVWAAGFQMAGAFGIWILALIQVHQVRLLAEERLEVQELERQRQEKLGGARTIFDEEDLGQMEKLAMGRRLRSIERLLIPVVALGLAVYHAVAGVSILPWFKQFYFIADALSGPVINGNVVLFFTGAIAFVCFMVSRYAIGLSRVGGWGVLRAGGNFMFGASAANLAISIALLFNLSGLPMVEVWLGRVIAILMIVLAVETVANYILDFYRPRVAAEPQRTFFDSRLLGVFSEPGGILQSLAKSIDYQFGFKVSETWFYKLMGRSIPKLVLAQIIIVAALSTVTVVPPGHQAVIEHLGHPGDATLSAGTHLTWPWPIDRAVVIPVERIQRMELGHEISARDAVRVAGVPILWSTRHFATEYKLMVADRKASETVKVPVNLLSVDMPLQWRVKPEPAEVLRYYRQSADVAGIIESLAYRELTRYAAAADIEDLLGRGGIDAAKELQTRIQAACDRAGDDGQGLGVQIVLVGLGGVHPPPDEDVAKAYEDVVSAFEKRDAAIKKAEGEAIGMRVTSAGTECGALYDAIVAEEQARASGAADLPERTEAVERMLRTVVGGAARQSTAEATGRTFKRVFDEQAAAERYAVQLAAYQSAPEAYVLRAYLRMLVEALRDVRKYVVALEKPEKVLYELDLKPPADLQNLLGAETAAGEMQRNP